MEGERAQGDAGFDGGGSLEKVKEVVEALVEFWSLWWFPWRWRRKKMKVKGWRSCSGGCGGGDEGGVGDGEGFGEVVKRIMKWNGEGKVFIGFGIMKVM